MKDLKHNLVNSLFQRSLARLLALSILAALSSSVFGQFVRDQNREIGLLKDLRSELQFLEIGDEREERLVSEVIFIIEGMYVHRFDKQEFYSDFKDPVVELKALRDRVDSLATAEVQTEILRIVSSLRDLHTRYSLPSPFSNAESFLPFTLARTEELPGFSVYRVSAVNKQIFKAFAANQRIPEIGDQLILYNDTTVYGALEERVQPASGANRHGGIARALISLTYRSHRVELPPEEDSVRLKFLDDSSPFGSDSVYTIELPWLSQFLGNLAPDAVASERLEDTGDLYLMRYNEFCAANSLEPRNVYPSNEFDDSTAGTFQWGIIENNNGKFGYIRLRSFLVDSNQVISNVIRLTEGEFANTDGLIFDVRSNPGGAALLADSLAQLFMPDEAEPMGFRRLNTELSRTFTALEGDPGLERSFEVLLSEAEEAGRTHSASVPLAPPSQVNRFGQTYFKPVAVLTDAKSYSASDLFACSMQDNGVALVYGEDPRTGAGGATVLRFFDLFLRGPGLFTSLPGGGSLSVSQDQMVRTGLNEGQLVEDFGARADVNVGLTRDDLLTGGLDQIEAITRSLAERGTDDVYASFPESFQRGSVVSSEEDAVFELFVRNTDYIDVRSEEGFITSIEVNAGDEPTFVFIDLSPFLSAGTHLLTFEGRSRELESGANEPFGPSQLGLGRVADRLFDLPISNRLRGFLRDRVDGPETFRSDDSGRLWNIKKYYVLSSTDVVVLGENAFEADFSEKDSVAPFQVFNSFITPQEDGWTLKEGAMQVGGELGYVRDVFTDLVLSFNIPQDRESTILSYDIETDISDELDLFSGRDSLELFVQIETFGDQLFQIGRFLSVTPQQTIDFDLSVLAGLGDINLIFRFRSNIFSSGEGVRISRVALQ